MPKVVLCGHDFIYPVCDIVRMYYEPVSVKESSVTGGNDGIVIFSIIDNDFITTKWVDSGVIHEIKDPVTGKNVKREVKRQLYQAFVEITGISFPWGSLTGIRPTIIANECKDEPSRLEKYYFVSKEKAILALETARNEKSVQMKLPPELIHCYIGIPFCMSRCLYCSFVSQEFQQLKSWIPKYVDTLIKEISKCLPLVEKNLQSIYIGGGTPTSLPDDLFEKLLQEISKHQSGDYFTEYTIEAGRADSITDNKLEIMKRYGVNRICINPQTLQDKTLIRIGRNHTSLQVQEAYAIARKFEFSAINMDLIAGLPGEVFEDFKFSLDKLLEWNPENITIHTLSLKRTSALAKMIKESTFANKESTLTDNESTITDLDNSLEISSIKSKNNIDNNENMPYDSTMINSSNDILDKKTDLRSFHMPNQQISDMIEYSIKELHNNGYHPYYLYRQKDMVGGHENVGYSKSGHECLYNVAMMCDQNSVIALGAGGMSKKIIMTEQGPKLERLPNIKDILSYMKKIDELINKKQIFFEGI